MALYLSSDTLTRIGEAQAVLLSPLAPTRAATWAGEALEALAAALGAESGFASLPVEDARLVTRGVSTRLIEGLRHYVVQPRAAGLPSPDPLVDVCDRRRRARGVQALSYDVIDTLLGGDLRRSPFYQDTHSAQRHAGAAVLLADPIQRGRPVEATVHLYFRRSTAFGDDLPQVLGLITPAFRAGVRSLLQLGEQRAVLDALAHPVAVVAADGRTLHRTPTLENALASDPQRITVDAAIETLAREVGGRVLLARPERTVATTRGRYRLRGTALPEGGPFGETPAVLVTVEPPAAPWPATAQLRDRFGLTPREAEVALLLAQGQANDAMAVALCISPHTARRHTERVMSKLGVPSRAQVAAAVLAPPPSGGPSADPPTDPLGV